MGKEGASNLVSLLTKSLESVVDMHNNDRVICSCDMNIIVTHLYENITRKFNIFNNVKAIKPISKWISITCKICIMSRNKKNSCKCNIHWINHPSPLDSRNKDHMKRKRKRSDSVLWQKPLHQQKCQKGKVTTKTTPQKSSIKQRLRTDLGRSVGVTTATQLVWLTGLRAHLPTNHNSRLIKRTHI